MPNKISLNIRCPSCSGELHPTVLHCHDCGIKIEGEFIKNEFNSLTPDELHFLRVFIRSEGRIGDMEAALGISYPTVKSQLTSLKKKLNLADTEASGNRGEPSPPASSSGDDRLSILSRLESGELNFKEAVEKIRANKKGRME
jgi:hypothetical protein